jgi:hypothetical protein
MMARLVINVVLTLLLAVLVIDLWYTDHPPLEPTNQQTVQPAVRE